MNREKVIANLSAEVNRLMNANIRLEEERADIWRRNRDTESSRDTKAAIIAELKAENESLRKDAEQWRDLVGRAKIPVIGYTGCVICGAYTDHGGLPCPKTRAAANALAMENQSTTPVEPLRVPHPLDAAPAQGEQP